MIPSMIKWLQQHMRRSGEWLLFNLSSSILNEGSYPLYREDAGRFAGFIVFNLFLSFVVGKRSLCSTSCMDVNERGDWRGGEWRESVATATPVLGTGTRPGEIRGQRGKKLHNITWYLFVFSLSTQNHLAKCASWRHLSTLQPSVAQVNVDDCDNDKNKTRYEFDSHHHHWQQHLLSQPVRFSESPIQLLPSINSSHKIFTIWGWSLSPGCSE